MERNEKRTSGRGRRKRGFTLFRPSLSQGEFHSEIWHRLRDFWEKVPHWMAWVTSKMLPSSFNAVPLSAGTGGGDGAKFGKLNFSFLRLSTPVLQWMSTKLTPFNKLSKLLGLSLLTALALNKSGISIIKLLNVVCIHITIPDINSTHPLPFPPIDVWMRERVGWVVIKFPSWFAECLASSLSLMMMSDVCQLVLNRTDSLTD